MPTPSLNISGNIRSGRAPRTVPQARLRRPRSVLHPDLARRRRDLGRRPRRLLHGRREHRNEPLHGPDRRHRLAADAASGRSRRVASRTVGLASTASRPSRRGDRDTASVTVGGAPYGLRVHAFRRLVELPRAHVDCPFEAALAIDAAETSDLALLRDAGWPLVSPSRVAGDTCGVSLLRRRLGRRVHRRAGGVHRHPHGLAQRSHHPLPRERPPGPRRGHRAADTCRQDDGLLTFSTRRRGAAAAPRRSQATTNAHRARTRARDRVLRLGRRPHPPAGGRPVTTRRIVVSGMIAADPRPRAARPGRCSSTCSACDGSATTCTLVEPVDALTPTRGRVVHRHGCASSGSTARRPRSSTRDHGRRPG